MSVLLQGVGRGREGEPGPVFSSCWIFPGAVSSPHLQENSNKRTKIIQVKLLFCVSQEPFEQAKGREPFSLTQSSLQRGGQHLSSLIGFSAPIFSLSVRTSLELFCTLAHLIWCAPFLLQGEDGGQWGQLEGRVPNYFCSCLFSCCCCSRQHARVLESLHTESFLLHRMSFQLLYRLIECIWGGGEQGVNQFQTNQSEYNAFSERVCAVKGDCNSKGRAGSSII